MSSEAAGDFRRQARKHLRASRVGRVCARDQRAGVEEVGVRVTGFDVIGFLAVFGAERHRDRIGEETDVHVLAHVKVGHALLVAERTGVEIRRRITLRVVQVGIDAVGDVERQVVLAVIGREIPVPATVRGSAHAQHRRDVVAVIDDLREEAVRVDLGDIARRVVGAVVAVGRDIALAAIEVAVQFDTVRDVIAEVEQQLVCLYRRVAIALVRDAGRVRGACERGGPVAILRAIGVHGVLVVPRHAHPAGRAAFRATQRHAQAALHAVLCAVALVHDAAAGGDAVAASGAASLEHHVDHAGNGVGAVLRRGAVAQHFDVIDRGDRYRIEVHRRRAAADRRVVIDQTGGVIPLAVHQHQHLVRRHAAQARRPDRVVAVVDGGAGEVERREQGAQGAGEIGTAGGVEIRGAQHVDGREGFGSGAVGAARSGDYDLLEQLGFFGRCRVGGRCFVCPGR